MPEPPSYKAIGLPFIELQSVDSTNNYALAQVNAGLTQHGSCFFTHEQLSGKGQRGKTWSSGIDTSLLLSAVIHPKPLSTDQQFQLSASIALAVYEFFSNYAGDATSIKWPNDLYWHDRKAGGILIENIIGPLKDSLSTASTWKVAIAGIGINLNQAEFPVDLKNAVSLRQITGKQFSPIALARELCGIMDKHFMRLLSEGFEGIYEEYNQRLYRKGKQTKFKRGPRSFEAEIRGVSRQGKLLIYHGIEEEIGFGEVEWVLE